MLLPTRARYAPGEPVVLETSAGGTLTVTRLGETVATLAVPAGATEVVLPELAVGGYGASLSSVDGTAVHTAVEVLPVRAGRLRYGFVANFAPEKPIEPVTRLFRRLHLGAAQFYDWAYRHADLVGPTAEWSDPLAQPVSLATVRALSDGFRAAGVLPLGYAAVYGVGKQEWPTWESAALLRPDGTPHDLAGFLSIVDPADPVWLNHFVADLRRAVDAGGFAGFHLDQYGFPRRAVRPDGRTVDLAVAFDTLIRRVRAELPEEYLIFNNVNDFPIWSTTRSPQDVTYTEVWEPHDTLTDIAAVASRARRLAPDRPAVLAAYQNVFTRAEVASAEVATQLTMATAFSHGATQLLAGESGHLLVDPYYVRHHTAAPSTVDMLARWYDLLVAAGDVLFDPAAVEITGSVVGALNDEIDVQAPVPVTHRAEPGVIWRRVVQTPHGTVIHLINLTDQSETGWDTPKAAVNPIAQLRLRHRRTGKEVPEVAVADPDRGPHWRAVPVTLDGGHLHAGLPPLHTWQMVLIRTPREMS